MKAKNLYIILAILILLLLTIIGIVLYTNKEIPGTKNRVEYWISYKGELYNKDKKLKESFKSDNISIELKNNRITICSKIPYGCEIYNYKREQNKYIIIGNEEASKILTITYNYKRKSIIIERQMDDDREYKLYIIYFKKGSKKKQKNILKYLTSYKEEKYNDKDEVIEKSDNNNYIIKVENDKLILCQNVPEKCTTINYDKNGDEYLKTSDKDSPELSFIDAYDEEYGKIIKMTKKDNVSEDSYTVIYFKINSE